MTWRGFILWMEVSPRPAYGMMVEMDLRCKGVTYRKRYLT